MNTDAMALSIPIIAIVLGMGIAFWSIYWEHRMKQLQYEERRLMIDKGMEPPPVLPDTKKTTPEDSLRRGTIMVFLGIGLGIAAWLLRTSGGDGPPEWLVGGAAAIVGLIGLGHLTYYLISTRRGSDTIGSRVDHV